MRIEEVFTGFDRGIASSLKVLGIETLQQLKKECVQNRIFIPLKSDALLIWQIVSLNYCIARFLYEKKLIPEMEVRLQLPLSCYYNTVLKKRSRKALRLHNIQTIRDIYSNCMVNGEFKVLKGKKIGPRVNYEAAQLLLKVGVLSEKAFLKVPLPSWKTRLLTDKEVGIDGRKKLHKMNWSDNAKDLIIHAVTLKFREYEGFTRAWSSITLGELVKTFVRINSEGTPVFYTKGHINSRWYTTEWFVEHFDYGFKEVRAKLEQFDYLPPENQ